MFDDINSMHTMFGARAGDFCHGLMDPDPMGLNWLGPKGFRDMSIGSDELYLPSPSHHTLNDTVAVRRAANGSASASLTLPPHRQRSRAGP